MAEPWYPERFREQLEEQRRREREEKIERAYDAWAAAYATLDLFNARDKP